MDTHKFKKACELRDQPDAEAIDLFLQLHWRADREQDFPVAATCMQQAGVAARNCGQPQRAKDLYVLASNYVREHSGAPDMVSVKAGILLDRGLLEMDSNPAEGETLIRQVVNLRRQLDDVPGQIIAYVKLGHCLALQGDWRGASQAFGRVESLLKTTDPAETWFWEATLRYHQAQMAEQRKQFDDAVDYAKQALRLHELHVNDQPHQKRHAELYALLDRCYQATGQPDQAREFEVKARAVLSQVTDPSARERVRQLAQL